MTPIRHHLAEAFAAVDARLADPNWHPSEQDVADAWAALGHERAARQFELLTNTPPSTRTDPRLSCRTPCGLGVGSSNRDRESNETPA